MLCVASCYCDSVDSARDGGEVYFRGGERTGGGLDAGGFSSGDREDGHCDIAVGGDADVQDIAYRVGVQIDGRLA